MTGSLIDGAYAASARTANTVRGYDADWRHFASWCARRKIAPLPADPRQVARYLTELVDGTRAPTGQWIERPRRVTTLERRLAAIRQRHRTAGLPFDAVDPVLHDTWLGIRRQHSAPPRAKEPTVTELVRALVTILPATLLGLRDRALLLLGFAGAFRRSELVGIDVADCAEHADGIVVTLRAPPSNAESRVEEVGIPRGMHGETCPVHALTDWLSAADITDGPVFRPVTRYGSIGAERLSASAVALVIKRAVHEAQSVARAADNEPLAESLEPSRYAGHSLRAGFIISAAAAGVSERDIMRHTRHKRADKLQRYMRHATILRHNAATKVGL
jgi:integrase